MGALRKAQGIGEGDSVVVHKGADGFVLLPAAPLTHSPTYRFGCLRPCPRWSPRHIPSTGNTPIGIPRYCLDCGSSVTCDPGYASRPGPRGTAFPVPRVRSRAPLAWLRSFSLGNSIARAPRVPCAYTIPAGLGPRSTTTTQEVLGRWGHLWYPPTAQRGTGGVMWGRRRHHVHHHLVSPGAPTLGALQYSCPG